MSPEDLPDDIPIEPDEEPLFDLFTPTGACPVR